jgi:hypothetical protein
MIEVRYETSRGKERTTLTPVPNDERMAPNHVNYGFDYVLRGEVYDGECVIWSGHNMSLSDEQLSELLEDIRRDTPEFAN